MGERCEVILDKEVYTPGEIINGRVECTFVEENSVRAIRVKFRGRAKVYWKEGRATAYTGEEDYFEMESDLLLSETTFPPGDYSYPFTFNLPNALPSSMDQSHGNIKYSVEATVDRPSADDCESKKYFTLYSYNDLNAMDELKKPSIYTEAKEPFSVFDDPGLITITAGLPIQGYVPSQTIAFTVEISNTSKITVKGMRFKIIQGFTYQVEGHSITHHAFEAPEFAVIDSSVAPGREQSWNLELRIPADMFNGSLDGCKIISVFWKLRVNNLKLQGDQYYGEVVLPFPYRNFWVDVPFTLGAVPLTGIAI